jgi:hypothetical protein
MLFLVELFIVSMLINLISIIFHSIWIIIIINIISITYILPNSWYLILLFFNKLFFIIFYNKLLIILILFSSFRIIWCYIVNFTIILSKTSLISLRDLIFILTILISLRNLWILIGCWYFSYISLFIILIIIVRWW